MVEEPYYNPRFFRKKNFWSLIFLILIPLWIYIFGPMMLKLPSDFKLTMSVDSFDNLYDLESKKYSGEKHSISELVYRVVEKKGSNLKISNSFEVTSLTGEKLFSVDRIYGIDSKTGEHITMPSVVNREGFLFAPRMKGFGKKVPDKSSFFYWHANYDTPILFEYRDEVEQFGLDLYRFESNFSVDQTKELTGILDGVGEEKGVTLNTKMFIWIEPYTGRAIQYSDSSEAYFYDLDTGKILYPWNKFYNTTTASFASSYAKEVSILRYKEYFVETIIPIILFIISVLLFFAKAIYRNFFLIFHKNNLFKSNWIIPIFVGSIGFLFALIMFFITKDIFYQRALAEFELKTNYVVDIIKDRLNIYTNVLDGASGLFHTYDNVSRLDWKKYVDNLDLINKYPGIQGVGYASLIEPKDLNSFEKSVQKEGFLDFAVYPKGERELYSSILYLEPFDQRNRRAFGFDMLSEPTRRKAMEYARDSGSLAMTGKVTLVQELDTDVQAGFLLYKPIYNKSSDISSGGVENNRREINGFVYAPFRMNNFVNGVFVNNKVDMAFEIYNQSQNDNLLEENLLYKKIFQAEKIFYERSVVVSLYNNFWTFHFKSGDDFGSFSRKLILSIIMLIGILSWFVLVFILHIFQRRGNKLDTSL